MPRGGWLSYLHSQAGTEIPVSLRLIAGAVSGAALSLSYTGFYLTIYSWVCVAILLLSLFGVRPRVAFGCGFLHGLLFVLTSLPWIATVLTVHGGVSIVGGWVLWLLMGIAWEILTGVFAWSVHGLSRQSIELACIGAPFLWVTFEFVRAHLPEIGFPWNLLGYPAAANLGFVQLTTITGIYGLSFLVAGFNALLTWTSASNRLTIRTRLIYAAVVTAILLSVALAGPRLVPQPPARHFARAVQLNFPEVESYPPDWFQAHAADLDEIARISLGPSAKMTDLLVWPEAPAPFSFQDLQFAKIAARRRVRWVHRRFPFDGSCEEWVAATDGQCRGNLCGLQILKGERRGRFRPHQKVCHFRGRAKADSCDFVEIRRVCLEPIRGVRFHFREIELHSAREMTSRWLRHQTRSSQRDAQQNCQIG